MTAARKPVIRDAMMDFWILAIKSSCSRRSNRLAISTTRPSRRTARREGPCLRTPSFQPKTRKRDTLFNSSFLTPFSNAGHFFVCVCGSGLCFERVVLGSMLSGRDRRRYASLQSYSLEEVLRWMLSKAASAIAG